MPAPKAKKLSMLPAKLDVETVARVSNAIIKAGLQGITIAPKKKPNENALSRGFLRRGTFALGNILVKSKLNIKNRLITIRIPNAIGDIMRMTDVKDVRRNKVKITPTKSMNKITPNVTRTPTRANVFRSLAWPESWLEI